jgi:hypothetical protein
MDKNLGLAVMNRDLYIEQVLREHLTTPTYLQLTSENALFEINNTKQLLLNAFHTQKTCYLNQKSHTSLEVLKKTTVSRYSMACQRFTKIQLNYGQWRAASTAFHPFSAPG